MNRKTGFTLIELLITMTIMVVLLTLTVASLRSSQAAARDEERKTDATVIAISLENYYKAGSDAANLNAPIGTLASTHMATPVVYSGSESYESGQYPPTEFMATEADVRKALRDLDAKALRAPGVAESAAMSLTMATNTSVPNPDIKTYVYQPLQGNGSLCTAAGTDCRKFNLFYKLESSTTVQKITSKHQ